MNSPEYYLIEKAKEGDNQALDEILIKEQKYVFNLMFQLTGNQADADDLTQEAIIKAFQKLHDFRFESKFRTWLSKIAINLFLEKIRRNPPHSSICLDKIKVPSSEDTPERVVIKREMQWCIAHILQQHMPRKYRVVLILRDLQDFSYKEISEILGWSIGKTKTRLHRARQMFRNHLINGKCKAISQDYRCVCEGISEI